MAFLYAVARRKMVVLFRRRRILRGTATENPDEAGQKRRETVQRAGFTVEHYEYGLNFGNIVLVAARGALRLRFVRDRGDSFSEARSILHPRSEHWVAYNPRAPFSGAEGMDIDDLLTEIFDEANQSRLSLLVGLAEDASRFPFINH